MVFQRINGVVGSAHDLNIIVLHQPTSATVGLLKHSRAMLVDFASGSRVKAARSSEGCLEFEMSPMVERIAHHIRHGLSPFHKLIPIRSIRTGDISFVYTVCTHGTPLVVIAFKPDFPKIFENMIRCNIFRIQVAVVRL